MGTLGPTLSQTFAGAIPAPLTQLPLKGIEVYRPGAESSDTTALVTASIAGGRGPFAAFALGSGGGSHPLSDMYFLIEGPKFPKAAGRRAPLAGGLIGRVSAKPFASDEVRFTKDSKNGLFYGYAGKAGNLSQVLLNKDGLVPLADAQKRDYLLRGAVVFVPAGMAKSLKVDMPDSINVFQIYFALGAIALARERIAMLQSEFLNRKAVPSGIPEKKGRKLLGRAGQKTVFDPAVALIVMAGRSFFNSGPLWASFAGDAFLMAAAILCPPGKKSGNSRNYRRAKWLWEAAKTMYPRSDEIGHEKLAWGEERWGEAAPVADEDGETGE